MPEPHEKLPPRRTTWTVGQNVARVAWATVGRLVWLILPAARRPLLRLFGGQVGPRARFAASARIYIPWHVSIGQDVRIGRDVILYSLGQITIGDGCMLDDRVHLCAGTHDMSDPAFPLVTLPITLGDHCRLGYDAFLAPGVELGTNCAVLPRSSVYRSFPADSQIQGNPARVLDEP